MNQTVHHRFPAYKRATAAAVLLLTGLWAGYLLLWPNASARAAGAGIQAGTPAPDFALKTLDGRRVTLSSLRGKPVMVNFFTTWCPSCRSEMPRLQQAYKQYESDGLVLLAVDLDENAVTVQAFQEKLGLTFPIVLDQEDQVSRMYDIVPLPTSYFIDRNGIVQARWTGEIENEQQLRSLLKKIL